MSLVRLRRELDASADAVSEAVEELTGGGPAWLDRTGVVDGLPLVAEAAPQPDGSVLEVRAELDYQIPYFGRLLRPLIVRDVRTRLRHAADSVEATVGGRPPPDPPGRPVWAPPVPLTGAEAATMGTIAFVLALAGYGGSLLTHTIDFVAGSYAASDAELGLVTAMTRVGTLGALAGSAAADRAGRRRIVLVATGLLGAATFLSAFAPTLWTFGALQVVVRGAANLVTVVALIALVEEAPEGARAYLLGLAGLAASAGFATGALLLPLADLDPGAWRVLYAVGGLGLAFLPSLRRRLEETRRYAELAAKGAARGRARRVVGGGFGGRFALLVATGFLLNLFFAPSSQFTNRYLAEVRGFSGLGILVLRTVTQSAPAIVAVWLGGRMAETHGRRPVATAGTLVVAVTGAAFFGLGGPLLWVSLLLSTSAAAFAGPSLAAFNTELFPTDVRGTAGAALLTTSVAGSIVGLLVAGFLAEPLGGIGLAVATLAAGPLLVGLFLIHRLPETRGLALDEVSPPQD